MEKIPRNARKKLFNCIDQTTRSWIERAGVCVDLLSTLASPDGSELALVDIGCGDQKLRSAIETRGLPLTYTGYDLLPQLPDVERFDVRHDTLSRKFDIVVMLGVIEYLDDLPAVFGKLSRQIPHMILSHSIRQGDVYSTAKLSELGWVNHLTEQGLETLLDINGYTVTSRRLTPDGRTLLIACTSRIQREGV